VLRTGALGGCVSSGLIGPLPTVSDPTDAAEIVVIREHRFSEIMTVSSTFSQLSISANTSTTGMDLVSSFLILPKSESEME
jgi:hypothetical protein